MPKSYLLQMTKMWRFISGVATFPSQSKNPVFDRDQTLFRAQDGKLNWSVITLKRASQTSPRRSRMWACMIKRFSFHNSNNHMLINERKLIMRCYVSWGMSSKSICLIAVLFTLTPICKSHFNEREILYQEFKYVTLRPS
jgi:hypothetical protein